MTNAKMKYYIIIVIMFVFVGCNINKESTNFEYVDFSYQYIDLFNHSNKPFSNYSLKIFNNGKTNLTKTKNNSKEKINYCFTLNKIELDSISQMINELNNNPKDSNYFGGSDGVSSEFCLIIKAKYKKYRIRRIGASAEYKKNHSLCHFVEYLENISKNATFLTDTVFVFESFIKPIIVDTVDEKVEVVTNYQTTTK